MPLLPRSHFRQVLAVTGTIGDHSVWRVSFPAAALAKWRFMKFDSSTCCQSTARLKATDMDLDLIERILLAVL